MRTDGLYPWIRTTEGKQLQIKDGHGKWQYVDRKSPMMMGNSGWRLSVNRGRGTIIVTDEEALQLILVRGVNIRLADDPNKRVFTLQEVR